MASKDKKRERANPSEETLEHITAVEDRPKAKATKSPPEDPRRGNRRPQPQEIRISARQYVRARGFRWERSAGFLFEMKRNHPGEKTREEWDILWGAFWSRPVK